MENKQKILAIILAACALLYFAMPPTGYQAEIAKRKQLSLAERKAITKEYDEKREKMLRDKKINEVREAAAKQQAEQNALIEAQQKAENENRASQEAQLLEQARANLPPTPEGTLSNQEPTAMPNGEFAPAPPQQQVAAEPEFSERDVASVPQGLNSAPDVGANAVRTQEATPTVSISRTNFATRFLYLRIKGRVLRFNVAKSISEPELDSLVRILANVCVSTEKPSSKCRASLTVDRAFYAVANRIGDESVSTDGWTLECTGKLSECIQGKTAVFTLSENFQSGKTLIATGFEGQTVGPKSLAKLTSTSPIIVDKVYVTRTAAR
jgi:hypothetical protein